MLTYYNELGGTPQMLSPLQVQDQTLKIHQMEVSKEPLKRMSNQSEQNIGNTGVGVLF